MDLALQIQDLSKNFSGNEVVKGISLEIQRGEIFGLLGPNGAGKSTTINMITGVTRLDRGKILVFDRDVQTDFNLTRRWVGVMHQEVVIDPFFPIGVALKIHSGYYGVKDDPEWRELIIDRLSLRPHLSKQMNRLSGGMKRRLMLAKALIHKPKLVILDEPTAGVDVELRRGLWSFIREINQQGTTVLLTTHYLEEAEEMCGRIAIMNHGEIITVDHTQNLMSRLDKKRLVVRFRSPIYQVPEALGQIDQAWVKEGEVVEFSVSRDTHSGDILDALYSSGAKIHEIETVDASLEDVFLSLTKERKKRVEEVSP